MIHPEVNQLREWKQIILQLKGLEKVDGRPLYKYRLSTKEFDALEDFLTNWVSDYGQHNDFSVIASQPGFSDLFVLFCAEWWRRRYTGEGFKWEPIFADLNIPANSLTQQQRSRCVEKGLKNWGLPLSRTGGHTYIGSVASQGGLPMKLLADAQGGIGTLISRVLRHAKTTSVSSQDLHGWIESLEYLLPKSFRQPAIFTLITDITWTVLDLKEKAGLTLESNPIVQLDQKFPDWRDRFPLPIEDSDAQKLIEQLIKEAAKIRPERRTLVLPVERTLEMIESLWQLRSSIELPEIINEKDLSELFNLDAEDLPRLADITVFTGDLLTSASMRRLAGRDAYRVARIPLEFSGIQCSGEHLLRLTSPDGRTWTASPPRGSALDDELPWLFANDEFHYRFVRQGTGSVAAQSALVAIPQDWSLREIDEQTSVQFIGTIGDLARSAYTFHGLVQAEDKCGNAYKLRTGNAADTEESYEWVGRRLWYELRGPFIAFREKPSLYVVEEDGTKRKVPGEIKCSAIGTRESASYGPIEARYPTNGEIKHRSRMLILPENSSLQIQPVDAHSGRIIFNGWKASAVITLTPNVTSEHVTSDGTVFLDVSVEQSTKTPETIDVKVFWSHTPNPVEIRVPFPANGVRGFDQNGQELSPLDKLAVQDLLGTRLIAMGLESGTKVRLKLTATDKDISRKHNIKSVPGALRTEIRIADYRREIDHLHAIDDNPDSTVALNVEIDGESTYRLNILPYQVRLERDDVKFWIECSSQFLDRMPSSEVHAHALALERPGEEPEQLQRLDGDNGGRIFWNFHPEDREDGAWLIYPPKDSALQFRPMLWTVGSEIESESQYVRATSTPNRIDREASLDEFIEAIASDFTHPGWIDVNQLANQVGHLPLSSLDIWRRFVRSSKAMAALALRFNNFRGDFLARFDNELPFSWDTVIFRDWKVASIRLQQQVTTLYGEEQGPTIFRAFLKSRVGDITAELGSLFYLFGILQAEYFDEEKQEALLVRRIFGPQAGDYLFRGENSQLMNLRRGHLSDDEEWPVGFDELLASARKDQKVKPYLYSDRLGFQDGVINLPLILAARVAFGETKGWFSDPKNVSLLHDYRSFDPDWFDEAFNLTIARCLANGLFD